MVLEPVVKIQKRFLAEDHQEFVNSQFDLARMYFHLRGGGRVGAAARLLGHEVDVQRRHFTSTGPTNRKGALHYLSRG